MTRQMASKAPSTPPNTVPKSRSVAPSVKHKRDIGEVTHYYFPNYNWLSFILLRNTSTAHNWQK